MKRIRYSFQGNVTSVMCGSGTIVQTASYYPYGEPWLEPEGDNRRLYGGKERLNFGGLRHSDFGARYLDTRAAYWNQPDPCAEEKYDISPYGYCSSDPVNRIDPNGLSDFWNNNSHVRINDGSNAVYMVQGNGAYRYYGLLGFDILQYALKKILYWSRLFSNNKYLIMIMLIYKNMIIEPFVTFQCKI